jgi:hypothetical protein
MKEYPGGGGDGGGIGLRARPGNRDIRMSLCDPVMDEPVAHLRLEEPPLALGRQEGLVQLRSTPK